MSFCAICGRHHDPATPCAVANRTAAKGGKETGVSGPHLARRIDLILAIAVIVALAIAVLVATR